MITPLADRNLAEIEFFGRYGEPQTAFWHNQNACTGFPCVIHHPSDHPMRSWTMTLRETALIERLCAHNIGHPDPDSWRAFNRITYGTEDVSYGYQVHGCDGCCARQPTTIRETW